MAVLIGGLAFLAGCAFGLYGLTLFAGAKSAMHETTAAIVLGTGMILATIAPLLAICAAKR